ncbi:hypothetical protein LguiA_025864 [Lonicera macranthoides]
MSSATEVTVDVPGPKERACSWDCLEVWIWIQSLLNIKTSIPWLIMPMWLKMRLLILLGFKLKDAICRAGHEYGLVAMSFRPIMPQWKVLGRLARLGLRANAFEERAYQAICQDASRRGLKSMPMKKGLTGKLEDFGIEFKESKMCFGQLKQRKIERCRNNSKKRRQKLNVIEMNKENIEHPNRVIKNFQVVWGDGKFEDSRKILRSAKNSQENPSVTGEVLKKSNSMKHKPNKDRGKLRKNRKENC